MINGLRICWCVGGEYPVERISDVLVSTEKPYDIIVAFSFFDRSMETKYRADFPGKINHVEFDDIFPHFWMQPQIYHVERSFYEEHNPALTELYASLNDDFSRAIMVSFVEQRISGDYGYSEGMVSNVDDRYYDPTIIRKNKQLVLVDCGAYDGEDTRNFFERYQDDLFAFVLEPDPDNFRMMETKLAEYDDSVERINKVVADCETTMAFSTGGGEGSGLSDNGDTEIESISIDAIYRNYKEKFAERDTIIKMDIEGAELKALKGAEQFIKEKMPYLAISLYHKPEDIIEIPRYLKSICPNYQFYLRRYNFGFRELIFYAVP